MSDGKLSDEAITMLRERRGLSYQHMEALSARIDALQAELTAALGERDAATKANEEAMLAVATTAADAVREAHVERDAALQRATAAEERAREAERERSHWKGMYDASVAGDECVQGHRERLMAENEVLKREVAEARKAGLRQAGIIADLIADELDFSKCQTVAHRIRREIVKAMAAIATPSPTPVSPPPAGEGGDSLLHTQPPLPAEGEQRARVVGMFEGWEQVAHALEAASLPGMARKVRQWAAIALTFPENAPHLIAGASLGTEGREPGKP